MKRINVVELYVFKRIEKLEQEMVVTNYTKKKLRN